MTTTTQTLSGVNALSRSNFLAELGSLWAVVRREWTIFRRYPSWYLAMFIWPIIFPAAYILIARALAGPDGSGQALFMQQVGQVDFLGYIMVGTTIWMWQNVVLWNVGFSLRDEQLRGTLESNWLSPTWRFSFLVGNSLVQLLTMVMMMAVAYVEYRVLLHIQFHGNPGMVLLMLLVCIPSIYGMGMAFASLVITAREAHTFVFLVRGIVMIFCGITYPISVLPNWMQGVAKWLPQTYMIHGLRNAILAGADLQALLPDIKMLLIFGVFWLAIGYLASQNTQKIRSI